MGGAELINIESNPLPLRSNCDPVIQPENTILANGSCKLIIWNTHGLDKDFIDDDHCGQYLKTGDVILLGESWAPPGDGDDLFPLDEFKAFKKYDSDA